MEDLDFDVEPLDPTPSGSERPPQPVAEAQAGLKIYHSHPESSQWSKLGSGLYRASGVTKPKLPAGVYTAGYDSQGNLVFARREIITDELIELPDTASERVMAGIDTFWLAKDRFGLKKQIFKRGILLWGQPGSGKTALITQLTQKLIAKDGIVFYLDHPELAAAALTQFRKIESDRHLICVLEDIDEMVTRYGEHALLNLLDGETQIKNVVFLATTNYPDRLAKRIINRPSRFDEVIKVGMPSDNARRIYLRSKFSYEELNNDEMEQWVNDTKDFSIAHLRELTVCVFCLKRDYNETIERLRHMDKVLNINDRKMGF